MKKNKDIIYLDKSNIVKEAHEFTEGNYHFKTVWEDRIFLMTLAQIKPNDEDFKEYKIYINDVKKLFKVTSKNIYSCVREAVRALRKMEITIPYREGGRDGLFTTGLLTGFAEGVSNMSYISVNLHPKLKPYFLQLKERYTMYNIAFLLKIKNSHSKRIYRLLKQYEKIKKRQFDVDDLREKLQIIDIYPDYFDFKKRVILKAQKDLQKYTDIKFSFKEVKKGRKVITLIFYISENTPEGVLEQKTLLDNTLFHNDNPKQSEKKLSVKEEESFLLVKDWGITKTTFLDLLSKYSLTHIKTCVEVTTSAPNVKNKAAYFVRLVQKEEVVDSHKIVETNNTKQRNNSKRVKELIKQREKELSLLKSKKYEEEYTIVKKLLERPDFLRGVQIKIEGTRYVKLDSTISFLENYSKGKMVRGAVDAYAKEMYPELFKSLNAKFDKSMEKVNERYGELLFELNRGGQK